MTGLRGFGHTLNETHSRFASRLCQQCWRHSRAVCVLGSVFLHVCVCSCVVRVSVCLLHIPHTHTHTQVRPAPLRTFQSTMTKEQLPKKLDWRGTPADFAVKDQGQCGSCWVSGLLVERV